MYAAAVGSKNYTFEVSGSLWQDALVMMDMETRSLWSQITGEGIRGENEGKKLTQFPAQHSTYAAFKENYPEGLLLSKEEKGSHGSNYEGYFNDPTKLGIFGRQDRFFRLNAKDMVLGVRHDENETAVSVSYLEDRGYALLDKMSPPIVVTYDKASNTSAAFELPELGLKDYGKINIDETAIKLGENRAWSIRTGKSVAKGGSDLKPVAVITSYWFAWATFFPDTELVN